MRRILLGVIAVCMVLACLPAKLSAAENKVFEKVWETDPLENVSFSPSIDRDGNVWGMNAVPKNPDRRNLVKLVDGKIVWTSKEEYSPSTLLTWSIVFHDNLVIASDVVFDFDAEPFEVGITFRCYTLEGELKWEKAETIKDTLPTYQYFKGKIWIAFKNQFEVIDPSTGEVFKRIDIPQTGKTSSRKRSLLQGFGDSLFDINMFIVFDDMIVLNNLNLIRALKVSDELEPELVWQKTLHDEDFLFLMNLMLWMNANPSVFMACDSETSVKCYDTRTGKEKWTSDGDLFTLAFLRYNEKYLINSTFDSMECHSVDDNKFLWSNSKMYIIDAFTEDYIFATEMIDLEFSGQITVIDIKTGETITKLDCDDFGSVTVVGDGVYVVQSNKITKYVRRTN